MTDQPMPTNNNVSEEENVSEAVLRSYLRKIEKAHQTGNATEHTYRAALQELLEALFSGITVTNEPKRIKCGAPDLIITMKQIPLGYIETKDIGISLDQTERTSGSSCTCRRSLSCPATPSNGSWQWSQTLGR